MSLSQDLINQFVELTKVEKEDKEATVNGTYKKVNGIEYVRIDGSDIWTPVNSVVEAEDGERVKVLIKDHNATVTGNITSPSARNKSVETLKDEVDEHGNTIKQMDNTITQQGNSIIQINNDIKQLNSSIQQIDTTISQHNTAIQQIDTTIKEQGDTIVSMNNDITQQGNKITSLNNTVESQGNTIIEHDNKIVSMDNTVIAQGNEIAAQGNKMEVFDSDIKILNSGFKIEDGVLTGLSEIIVQALETGSLDAKYANIDFANINAAAVQKVFSESGIIKDLIVSEGHITGELVGVTIKGDLIEGNTIKADKLVVKGSDGLYYKLNMNAETVEAQQTDENSLNGSIITAKSITATKIQVDDLVAFGATIGGFNIDTHAIYSGVKSSIDNTTRGLYFNDSGEVNIGDSNNFIKYFLDTTDNKYKLQISAGVIKMGGLSKTLEETVKEIQDATDKAKEEIEKAQEEIEKAKNEMTTFLQIESSKGTVFKNDQVSTLLSVTIYRGSDRITDMTTLRSLMGNSVYLQWSWKRLNDEEYGVISASDTRIGHEGFTFLLSPEDVDTKVTFLCELME